MANPLDPTSPQTPRTPVVHQGPVYKLTTGFDVGTNGDRNGHPVFTRNIGLWGDVTQWHLNLAALFNIVGTDIAWRAGPLARFFASTGGENLPGTGQKAVMAGPETEVDFTYALCGDFPICTGRVGAFFTAGRGWGTDTPGTFSHYDVSGWALDVGARLLVVEVRVADLVALALNAEASSSAIYSGDFNTPRRYLGGNLEVRSTNYSYAPECHTTEERMRELPNMVMGDRAELESLRSSHHNRQLYLLSKDPKAVRNIRDSFYAEALSQTLRSRGMSAVDDDKMRPIILEALKTEDTEEKQNKLIISKVNAILTSQSLSTDSTERTLQIAEGMAKQRFPENYDYFAEALREVDETPIPDPLPTDCTELDTLRNQLEDERAALRERIGFLKGGIVEIAKELALPVCMATDIVQSIRNVGTITFNTNAPFGKTERYKVKPKAPSTIEYLDEKVSSYLSANQPKTEGLREPMDRTGQMNLFAYIFAKTLTRDNISDWISPSIDAIRSFAELLRKPEMRGAKVIVVGKTDSRGEDDFNQRLSLRRARAVRDVLITEGVVPEAVFALGQGEENPAYWYDQSTGKSDRRITKGEIRELKLYGVSGKALTEEMARRQASNRRTEIFVCMPETTDPNCVELLKAIQAAENAPEQVSEPQQGGAEAPARPAAAPRREPAAVVAPPPVEPEPAPVEQAPPAPPAEPASEGPGAGGTDDADQVLRDFIKDE